VLAIYLGGRQAAAAAYQATHDALTDLPNRPLLLARVADALSRRRPGTGTWVALVDLDHFKSINDTFGHAIGDRVLEIFTDSARQALRGSDLIGRLGGEEFAVLLYDMSREQARDIAERIRESFTAATRAVDGHVIAATVSIGLAHCDGAVLEIRELLAQADRALYFAKENGRDRVEIASLDMVRAAARDAKAGKGKVTARSAA
jgi:diguanylate cyclase (GGDEF)-like protein